MKSVDNQFVLVFDHTIKTLNYYLNAPKNHILDECAWKWLHPFFAAITQNENVEEYEKNAVAFFDTAFYYIDGWLKEIIVKQFGGTMKAEDVALLDSNTRDAMRDLSCVVMDYKDE